VTHGRRAHLVATYMMAGANTTRATEEGTRERMRIGNLQRAQIQCCATQPKHTCACCDTPHLPLTTRPVVSPRLKAEKMTTGNLNCCHMPHTPHTRGRAPAQGVCLLAADVDGYAGEQTERDHKHEEHGE
jgi:hypothetical protein